MKKIMVSPNEAGQRLDKLLAKYMSEAPKSFLYKMLRKKNIKLNGKKAQGNEKLNPGDEITLFLAEETIEKFSGRRIMVNTDISRALAANVRLDIIYEDEHVLFLDKPAGMLSQKAEAQDLALNEYMIAYLIRTHAITQEELKSFKPAVCNRLDRNTSGLVAAGKTLPALQQLSDMFRERSMKKYYLTLVEGVVEQDAYIHGYLKKNEQTNKVAVSEEASEEAQEIETAYRPLAGNSRCTLLEVHLITGRTHQIRAHLASTGHPVIGDYKYGNHSTNTYFKKHYQVQAQVLHAWRMEFGSCRGALSKLSERELEAPLPDLMKAILEGEKIRWEPGIRGA